MTNEEIKAMLDKEHAETAIHLERSAMLLQKHIKALKGEEQDLTGLGLRRIFLDSLERALNVKIIPRHQWDYFVKMEERQSDV